MIKGKTSCFNSHLYDNFTHNKTECIVSFPINKFKRVSFSGLPSLDSDRGIGEPSCFNKVLDSASLQKDGG